MKEMREQDFKLRLLGIRLSNFQDENEEKNQQARIDDLFKKKLEKAKESVVSTNSDNELNNSSEIIEYNDQVDGLDEPDQPDAPSYLCPVCSIRRFTHLNELNEHVCYLKFYHIIYHLTRPNFSFSLVLGRLLP